MEPVGPNDPAAVGPYEILGRLGSGGMGVVYLARSATGDLVAVKLVHPQLATDQEFRARFQREVSTARMVRGRYTVPVIDSDANAPQPWLATAYIPGLTLSQTIDEHGPLPEESVRTLALGLVDALASIHAVGLVHRDVKPSNVILASDGPRVIDFGIARNVQSDTRLTRTGLSVGTIGYVAPEVLEGQQAGPAADVFSLGVVLAFAATGAHPFADDGTMAGIVRILTTDPDLDGVPATLRATVEGCLRKQPADRLRLTDVVAGLSGRSIGSPEGTAWLPQSVQTSILQSGPLPPNGAEPPKVPANVVPAYAQPQPSNTPAQQAPSSPSAYENPGAPVSSYQQPSDPNDPYANPSTPPAGYVNPSAPPYGNPSGPPGPPGFEQSPYGNPSSPPQQSLPQQSPYGNPSGPPQSPYGPSSAPPAYEQPYVNPSAPPLYEQPAAYPQPGYGTPPPAAGYGPPPVAGYGAPPAAGYGAQPPTGYGAQPAGFGAPPPGYPGGGYPPGEPPPRKGVSPLIPIVIILAVLLVVAAGTAVAFGLKSNDDGPSPSAGPTAASDPVKLTPEPTPTETPAESPSAGSSSAALTGGDLALYNKIDTTGFRSDSCTTASSRLSGTVGHIECRGTGLAYDIQFAQFTSASELNDFYDTEKKNVTATTTTAGKCGTDPVDSTWESSGGTKQGRLICFFDTDKDYWIVWGYDSQLIVGFVVDETPSQAQKWWETNGNFLK